jgi:hypothetical protein
MRLFRLTAATIFRRKAWVVCVFALLAMPFLLPVLSSAAEKPIISQPTRVLTAWGTLWICGLFWGLFTAARQGETNARFGLGDYFLTTGISPTRQLFEMWLAVFIYLVPFALIAAGICLVTATPADPGERSMWWATNGQYLVLFLLVVAPLLALAIAIASRFGAVAGFSFTLALSLYGLYGVGYLENMLSQEKNPLVHGLWLASPHYHLAEELTQRLSYKLGALPAQRFLALIAYFSAVLLVTAGFARLCFRGKSLA